MKAKYEIQYKPQGMFLSFIKNPENSKSGITDTGPRKTADFSSQAHPMTSPKLWATSDVKMHIMITIPNLMPPSKGCDVIKKINEQNADGRIIWKGISAMDLAK